MDGGWTIKTQSGYDQSTGTNRRVIYLQKHVNDMEIRKYPDESGDPHIC